MSMSGQRGEIRIYKSLYFLNKNDYTRNNSCFEDAFTNIEKSNRQITKPGTTIWPYKYFDDFDLKECSWSFLPIRLHRGLRFGMGRYSTSTCLMTVILLFFFIELIKYIFKY